MIKRNIIKIDAAGEAIGRLASRIALILRGKNKPEFIFHKDEGDIVEVINIDKVKFTGKKLEQKKYFKYSGYPGGLKTKKISELKEKNLAEILKHAVRHMLPANKLRSRIIKRLIIK